MNEQNLTPFNTMDKERQRQIAKMGGEACGEKKRRLKSQRELVNIMLSTPSSEANKQILKRVNIGDEDATLSAELGYKLIEETKKGKEWAFNMLYKLTGQFDSEEIIEKQRQEIEKLKLECEKLRQETNMGSDTYEDLTPLVDKLGLRDGEK